VHAVKGAVANGAMASSSPRRAGLCGFADPREM
jgi:hypothetical protein